MSAPQTNAFRLRKQDGGSALRGDEHIRGSVLEVVIPSGDSGYARTADRGDEATTSDRGRYGYATTWV